MRSQQRRLSKGIIAAVLMTVMMLGVQFAAGITARADGTADKTISGLGTAGIANPTDGKGGWSKVYFGSKGTPILFNVLKNGETNFSSSENPTLLLDCAGILERRAFDTGKSNNWTYSSLKNYLNGTFKTNRFTAQEVSAITASVKNQKGNGDGDGCWWSTSGKLTQGLLFKPLYGEQIFLLDAVEITNTSYGFVNDRGVAATRVKKPNSNYEGWWLRSPDSIIGECAGDVWGDGSIGNLNVDDSKTGAVSPALNVNLSSVFFSSLISKNPNTYTLTLEDSGRKVEITSGKTMSRATKTSLSVPYTTDSGSNHVSLLITNRDDSWISGQGWTSGAVMHYYTTAAVSGTEGEVKFTLPDNYDSKKGSWKVWLLAEQVNKEKETDYAGAPLDITTILNDIPVPGESLYTIKTTDAEHLRLTTDKNKASAGETVTVTAYVDGAAYSPFVYVKRTSDGKQLMEVPMEGVDAERCRGTFTMPDCDVTLTGEVHGAGGDPTSDEVETTPKGESFRGLKLSGKGKKGKVALKWDLYPGAAKYAVYGNRCGKQYKAKLIKTVKGSSYTANAGSGIYQKYYVKALDRNGKVLATSKTIHVARKGYGYGDPTGVKLNCSSIKVKVGKKAKVKGTMVKGSLPVSVHCEIRYESSNPKIAKVNEKTGEISGKRKGACYVYAYAQNGLYKKVKVKVQ